MLHALPPALAGGWPPHSVETTPYIHLLHQCYTFKGPGMEQALYEIASARLITGLSELDVCRQVWLSHIFLQGCGPAGAVD